MTSALQFASMTFAYIRQKEQKGKVVSPDHDLDLSFESDYSFFEPLLVVRGGMLTNQGSMISQNDSDIDENYGSLIRK
jgi:hypothetical protein